MVYTRDLKSLAARLVGSSPTRGIFMKQFTDEQLVATYLQGEEVALAELLGRYLSPIFSFTRRQVGAEAADLTQEVFIRVWKNFRKFKQEKNFKVWLYTIAKNVCRDWWKQKKEIPFSTLETAEENLLENLPDPEPLPLEIFARAEAGAAARSALEKLPPAEREVLLLYYDGQFTLSEIAEILGESANTIKSRHRRALIKLREILLK